MKDLNLEKSYFILFSFIPVSIVLGPSISLINILIISIFFLSLKIFDKSFIFKKDLIFFLLIFVYIYLLFNLIISIDYTQGIFRNFGFLRYILLFFAINYYFSISKRSDHFFLVWTLFIYIIVFDIFIEFFLGRNLFGYGEAYANRIVSFFKDEPIVGGYILGFMFIIVGFLFDKFKDKKIHYKVLILILLSILFISIVLTGERSNSFKAVFGIIIFLSLNRNINLSNKIIMALSVIIIVVSIIFSSNYLKARYGHQLFSNFFDSEKRSKYIEWNPYLRLYKSGYAMFKDYPIFGVGNKNYRIVAQDFEKNEYYYPSTHPHQIYFEFLSEHGIVGSIILLCVFFYLIFKNLKIIILSKNSLQLGCFSYLIINFLPILPSGAFFNDFNSNLFWLNLAIMYACNPNTNIFLTNK
tara:strand:+ start:1867 stop:3102 length:1236 start_codon:yes stop_codon:yes gene_type:complete